MHTIFSDINKVLYKMVSDQNKFFIITAINF